MVDYLEYIHKQIGDYYILRWLGGGSFGNVYLAEQVRDHSQAALKLLHIRLTQSEDLKAFINEARTIRLKHPHIVSLLDFGISSENIPFLVMNYAAQGTLRDRYPKGTQVPPAMLRKYVQQIASALHYAHEQRLIHRDVKPENMLLNADGSVLLSDFGISSVAHSSQSASVSKGISGTIAYMAPEQIQGQTRAASDQYSFGIVVYEWLAGRRPFEGTTTEIAIQHLMNTPPPLRTFVPTLPVEVEQVVLQTLAKDPRQRFATMQAFATAFEQAWLPFAALSSPPLNAGPQTPQQTGTTQSARQTLLINQPSLPTGQPTASSQQTPPALPAAALPPAALLQNVSTTTPVPPDSQQAATPPAMQRTMSRRALVAGLVGVAAVGATAGGIALYTHISNSPTAFAFPPHLHRYPSSNTDSFCGCD